MIKIPMFKVSLDATDLHSHLSNHVEISGS